MPIEIKELHIKATVVEKKTHAGLQQALPGLENDRLKQELIKACVQEVLQILADKQER